MYKEKQILIDRLLDNLEAMGYSEYLIPYTHLLDAADVDVNAVLNLLVYHNLLVLKNKGISLRSNTPAILISTIFKAILIDTSYVDYIDIANIIDSDVGLTMENKVYSLITVNTDTPITMEDFFDFVLNVDARIFIYIESLFKEIKPVEDEVLEKYKSNALAYKGYLNSNSSILVDIILNSELIDNDSLPVNKAVVSELNLTNDELKKVYLFTSLVFNLDIVEVRKLLGNY